MSDDITTEFKLNLAAKFLDSSQSEADEQNLVHQMRRQAQEQGLQEKNMWKVEPHVSTVTCFYISKLANDTH